MKSQSLVVWFLVIVFSLATTLVFAAGDGWFVIKDKNGVCKVIEAKEKTPATIAGPFKTKQDAEKAKDKECQKGASTTEKIKGAAQEQLDKAKSAADKIKDKIKEAIPSDKKK